MGTPAVQIAGPTAPWLTSAPLWPSAIAVVIILAAGVCKQCHHPGEPVQTGGVVGQVNPAHAHQVHQGAPCNGAATAVAAGIQQGGQRPLHARQQQPHRVGAHHSPGFESPCVVGLAPPSRFRWQQRRRLHTRLGWSSPPPLAAARRQQGWRGSEG